MKPIKKVKAEYFYSHIEFFLANQTLYFKMRGSHIPTLWFFIKDARNYTALDIVKEFDGGRHFEDGIMDIWHEQGFDLGYTKSITRPL